MVGYFCIRYFGGGPKLVTLAKIAAFMLYSVPARKVQFFNVFSLNIVSQEYHKKIEKSNIHRNIRALKL